MQRPANSGWMVNALRAAAAALFAVAVGMGAGGGQAEAAWGFEWWPDSPDAGSDARATWVYFNSEYEANWANAGLLEASLLEMRASQADVVIISLTPAEMAGLANAALERTAAIQQLLDSVRGLGITAYLAYWEDAFSGSRAQMASYTAVDSVIAFNAANGAQADVTGVVTDFEMHGANRTAKRFDQWRQFHSRLKERMAGSGLRLLPALADPAALLNGCGTCTAKWRRSNGISGSDPDYWGDVAYFTSYRGVRFADGLIGLYYRGAAAAITASAKDDIVEGAALQPPAPIVVGFSVGPNGADPSLLTREEVAAAIVQNEAERALYPLGTAGTMAWRWDDPADGDAEYRDTWLAR